LHFLFWYQRRNPAPYRLIGLEGENARVTVTSVERRAGKYGRRGYGHPAFTNPSVPRTVHPMAFGQLTQLQSALKETSKRPFIKARNGAIIKMLAESGIRRTELTHLTLHSYQDALKDVAGRLDVLNAKRTDGSRRQVPVDVDALSSMKTYVNVHRALRIKELKKNKPFFVDEGWLFCKENGAQLSEGSITHLFSLLKRAANIKGRVHPHMLRHRWITLQLIRLLEEIKMLGSKLAADLVVTVLKRLASLSGHGSQDALWSYIDFAAEEMLLAASNKETREVNVEVLRRLGGLAEEFEKSCAQVDATSNLKESLKAVRALRVELAKILVESDEMQGSLVGLGTRLR
jgi:integrase